jgi:aspartate aminotransferase, mitochondrial
MNDIHDPWATVKEIPTDIVYRLTEEYNKDTNPNKVILCAGAYRNDEGQPELPASVRLAEAVVMNKKLDHEYLGILGSDGFKEPVLDLIFGDSSKCNVAFSQTVAGTGALRVLAELFNTFNVGNRKVYVSNPTWRNHYNIFNEVKFDIRHYRYIKNDQLDFEGLCDDIRNADNGSLFLFHACAHNPTGIDPNIEQWIKIEKLIKKNNHVVLFDMAYQGFGTGNVEFDAFPIRYFKSKGHLISVAQTFSKNMSLYGERVGSLSVVTHDAESCHNVESQLKKIIRAMYSTPSLHGARLATEVLTNSQLREEWDCDVKGMFDRILDMRTLLSEKLSVSKTLNWKNITEQNGMFYLSNLTVKQVKILKEKYHIYVIDSGRISIVGLTTGNIDYVSNAMLDVTS